MAGFLHVGCNFFNSYFELQLGMGCMDLESFGQCLSYMQEVTQGKGAFEMLLPYGGAFVGVVFGFFLNFAKDAVKESRDVGSKKICIDEDVHRFKYSLEHTVAECVTIFRNFSNSLTPDSHQFPVGFSLPMLDEYFSKVAHKYSVDERYYLKELSSYLESLNCNLSRVVKNDAESSAELVACILNLMSDAMLCIGVCSRFYGEKNVYVRPEDILLSMGFSSSDVDAYGRAVKLVKK